MKFIKITAILFLLIFAQSNNTINANNKFSNFIITLHRSLPNINNLCHKFKNVVVNNAIISIPIGLGSVFGFVWYLRNHFSKKVTQEGSVKKNTQNLVKNDVKDKESSKVTITENTGDLDPIIQDFDDEKSSDSTDKFFDMSEVEQYISPIDESIDEVHAIDDEQEPISQITVANDSEQSLNFQISRVDDGNSIHQVTMPENAQGRIIIK